MTSRLSAGFPMSGVLLKLALNWWIRQLAELMPAFIKLWWEGRRQWVVIDLASRELIVRRFGKDTKEIFRAPLSGEDMQQHSTVGKPPVIAEGAVVAVRLPSENFLRRKIVLPWAAEAELGAVLVHELERQTPFIADQVYFDWRILERTVKEKRIKVELAVISRDVVRNVLERVRACGLNPAVVGVYQGPMQPPLFNVLPVSGKSRISGKRRRVTLFLTALAILLGASNAAVWLWRLEADSQRLETEIAKARQGAQAVTELRTAIKRITGQRKLLVHEEQAPRVVDVLRELTRLLPKDTWIFSFQLNNGKGSIRGYSPSAPDLIGIFSQSRLFTRPHFVAPLTQGPKAGFERFDMAFEIRRSIS